MKKMMMLVLAVLFFFSAAELYAESAQVETEYAEGEVLVLMEETVSGLRRNGASSTAAADYEIITLLEIEKTADTGLRRSSAGSTKEVVALVKSESVTTEELLTIVAEMPGVKGYAKNYANYPHSMASGQPSDSLWGSQWGTAAIGAQQVWAKNDGGEEVIVAVIDTGLMYDHEDLASNVYTFPESFGPDLSGTHGFWYFYDGHDNSRQRVQIGGGPTSGFTWNNIDQIGDVDGHGSHVAGIIGAEADNGRGVAGIGGNKVKLLAFNVYSPSYTGDSVTGFPIAYDSDVIRAADAIVKLKEESGLNIRAANMSFGSWRKTLDQDRDPFGQAIRRLSDAGVIVVMSAGNEGQDIDNPSGQYVGMRPYPASFQFENTITVAAVQAGSGSTNYRASYSNYSSSGSFVDMAAPGSGIISTVRYTSLLGAANESYNSTGYMTMNGTSMAAPMVTGTAALISSIFPAKSAAEIKRLVLLGGNPTVGGFGISAYGAVSAIASYNIGHGDAAPVANPTPYQGGPGTGGGDSGEGGGGGGCSTSGSFAAIFLILGIPFMARGASKRIGA